MVGACRELLRSLAPSRVNTSLSRTLFFLVRWCIREGVHLDSRMHAATKPNSSEGKMAKKAKKAKKAVKKTAKTAAKKTAKKTKKVSKKK